MRSVSLCYYDIWRSCRQPPLALPKGEPRSARNVLHRTVYRSAPVLSVRQTGIVLHHSFVKVLADFLTRCGKRLAVGFLPRGKGAVPLGGGTICRHIFKRDNVHLCGEGNAARLHSSSGAAPASTNHGRTRSWESSSGIRSWMGAAESLGAVVRMIKQFTPFIVS